MSHEYEFLKDTPAGTSLAGSGPSVIQEKLKALQERMALDHFWGEETDTTKFECDGYHKKISLTTESHTMTPISDAGIVFSKFYFGNPELHYCDGDGNTIPITRMEKFNFYGNTFGESSFRAQLGENSTVSSHDFVILPFNTVQHNIGGNFSTADYYYTVPDDGYYSVRACCKGQVAGGCSVLGINQPTVIPYYYWESVDEFEEGKFQFRPNGYSFTGKMGMVLRLKKGDKLAMYGSAARTGWYSSGNSGITYTAHVYDKNYTFFSVTRII